MNKRNLNIFSFFSGAGFLDLGFEKEGFHIDYVNEFNESFLNAYKYSRKQMNIKEPKFGYFCGDINELLRGKKKVQFLQNMAKSRQNGLVGFIGGPPCPDFSVAGKNKGITGQNGRLTSTYKRIILTYEPDFFVFENVKGLWATKKHREEYKKLKRAFSRKDYVYTDKLVNSLEYGVPQDRERIILFAVKSNLVNDEKKEARKILKANFNWGNKSEYSLERVKANKWPDTSPFSVDSSLEKPNSIIEKLTVEYWFQKNDVYNHYNSNDFFKPKSMDRFNTILEGDVSRKSFKRLHRWRYSPTAAYGNNEVHLHPYKARRISVAEALAIQSLPKDFKIPKTLSKSEMFKTIGNGVPYLLAKEIAREINIFIKSYVTE